jgi:CDGSH-type Zn-finger protein
MAEKSSKKWIEVEENGPYIVYGDIPLVRKIQVVTEFGEPIAWKKQGRILTSGVYKLCSCGKSTTMPFCDMSHHDFDFDGTEHAPTDTFAERQEVVEGGEHIVVKRDMRLCMESGFCGTRFTNIDQMTAQTADTAARSLVIAMIERCPSGAYSYSIEPGTADIEPDLPMQIAVTTEMTSDGPIPGAFWVTGGIPIKRSDGQPFEKRNRVTLCSCGLSKIKPLCDGAHREEETKKLRAR